MSLKDKYTALLQEARSIADMAVTEDRGFTEDEKVRIEKMLEDASKMKTDYQVHQQIASLEDLAELKERKHVFSGSISEQVLKNPAYQAWYKSVAPSGYIPESRKGLMSPPIELSTLGLFKKDLITGADSTSAGAFVVPQDTGIYEGSGATQLF